MLLKSKCLQHEKILAKSHKLRLKSHIMDFKCYILFVSLKYICLRLIELWQRIMTKTG